MEPVLLSAALKRSTRALLSLALALWLGACSQESADPAAWLRIGTNVWPGYEPLYLARDLGYLDNSPVKLVEYPSASEVIRAFRNGAIEAAALTLDEVLLLEQSGLQPRVVLVMDISNGGDAIIGRRGLQKMTDLKGLKVGVEATALGAFVLSRALDVSGLAAQDVEAVPLEATEHQAAFLQGTIDAVVTFEPVRSTLLDTGATLLFDSRQIPGEVVDVLVIRESYLEKNRPVTVRLLEQWFLALAYLKQHPQDAAKRISKRTGTTAQEFLASLDGLKIPDHAENLDLLGGEMSALARTGMKLQDTMRTHKLLKKDIAVATIIDGGML
jgi:NitT/TauT family transport system substrate-binding protein